MKSNFLITNPKAHKALKIDSADILSAISESESESYLVHSNGSLFKLCSVDGISRSYLNMILKMLPNDFALQLYTHYHPFCAPRHYVCATATPVFKMPFSSFKLPIFGVSMPFIDMRSIFQGKAYFKEYLTNFEEGSKKAESDIEMILSPFKEKADLFKNKRAGDFYNIIAGIEHLDDSPDTGDLLYKSKGPISSKGSFITLPNERICLSLNIASPLSVLDSDFYAPPSDLEYMSVSTIYRLPKTDESKRAKSSIHNLEFMSNFSNSNNSSNFMTVEFDVNSLNSDTVSVAHFSQNYLVFDSSATKLRDLLDSYINHLKSLTFVANANTLSSRDVFVSLMPGNAYLSPYSDEIDISILHRIAAGYHK